MNSLSMLLSRLLKDLAERIDSGSCTMTDEELLSALETLQQYDNTAYLSKDLACSFLRLSRSTFDDRVRKGEIPKGLKVRGLKELFWKRSDLIAYDIKQKEK